MELASLNIGGTPNRGNASYPSGRIWPDGTFSLGYVHPRKDERLDARPAEYSALPDDGTAAAAPLDLRNVPNSDTAPRCPISAGSEGQKGARRPEKYGKKGITSYGRKMVRSVGALIDRDYPRHRTTFCTVTMPELPGPLRVELAQAWPRLVNELMKWLRRRLEQQGLPVVVASVTEIQPRRLQSYGEGYLHLHLLWLNKPGKSGNWAVDVLEMRTWVADWLVRHGLWSKDSHVNVDVRSVKGEKSRYLSKYASKGSAEIQEFASDNGWDSIPGQWWNMSNAARNWIKENLIEGRVAGEILESLVEASFERNVFGHFHYLYHIDIEVDGRLLNVGWRGGLKPGALLDVAGWVRLFSDA